MSTTLTAPAGSRFEDEEVKTAKGTQSLGTVPMLIWTDHAAMTAYYGEDGVLAVADGTSLRVSFQNIARRFKAAKKTDDEIAKAQIDFRPGKRAGGTSTPASRAARAAKGAVEKTGDADEIAKLLQQIESGAISLADVKALNQTAGK